MKANFSLEHNDLSYVLIRDKCNETGTMSVTNDAEAVVKYLKDKAILIDDAILYYIDSIGRVDILEHDGNGNLTGFRPAFPNEYEFHRIRG